MVRFFTMPFTLRWSTWSVVACWTLSVCWAGRSVMVCAEPPGTVPVASDDWQPARIADVERSKDSSRHALGAVAQQPLPPDAVDPFGEPFVKAPSESGEKPDERSTDQPADKADQADQAVAEEGFEEGFEEGQVPARALPPTPVCDTAACIVFEGPIHSLSEHYFYRKLEKARKLGVDLVMIEIDSPGGEVDSSFNLARRIRDIDWATVVVFIPREALSGGAIMALGSPCILIGEDAVMGDAGPIELGEDSLFRHVPEKVRSDIARRVRDLAEAQGRPPALAEAMIDKDLVVYSVTNRVTGVRSYMSDAELQSLDRAEDWVKGKPVLESRKGAFLEVNGKRAVVLQLADGNAADRQAVCERYQVKGQPVILKTRGVDIAVMVLNHPVMTGLLFIVGLIALYVELSAPGIGLGGLVSLLCFAVFFWSRFLGGTAGMLELVLFFVGVAFLAVEVFVLPGFGISGVTGLLLMLVSVVLASQGFIVPRTDRDLHVVATSLVVVVISGVLFLFGAVFISRRMGSIPILRSFTLQPAADGGLASGDLPEDRAATPTVATLGAHPALVGIGDEGVADSALRPAGRARFGDAYLDVVADGSFVTAGSRIRVIAISGIRVLVRAVESDVS